MPLHRPAPLLAALPLDGRPPQAWLPTRPRGRRRRRAAALLLIGGALALAGQRGVRAAPADEALAQAAAQAASLVQEASAQAAAGRRHEVEVGRLPARLQLAPCERIEPYLPPGFRAWGRTQVGLRCAAGPVRWNVHLPLTVRVYGEAVVLRRPVPPQQPLRAEELGVDEVDLAALPSPVLEDASLALGRTLARSVAPGQALRSADLRARTWFQAGTPVALVARGRGFEVRARGEALGPGLDGQTVRVRLDGQRVVSGVAVGPDTVEVRL